MSGETFSTQNENVQMRDKITSLERMMQIMIEQNNTLIQNANVAQNNVPVGDLLSNQPAPSPGPSKGKGRGKGRTQPPPPPPPRQQSLLSKIFPMTQQADPDPDYRPEEDDDDESQSVASRVQSTRSSGPTSAPIPNNQSYQAGKSSRYISSLQLEINRFLFFTFYI